MRLIDADAIVKDSGFASNIAGEKYYHHTILENAPTVDVGLVDARTVVHAEWVDEGRKSIWDNNYRSTRYHCSNCNRRAGESKFKSYKYCPNCGARMDETRELSGRGENPDV